jgi:simple sugar transport system permease protein
MSDFLNSFGLFLHSAIQNGTPILLAILGGIMCEKVGNLNLGIEGMMLLGASFGFLAGAKTENALIAVCVAAAAGAIGALIYAFITVTLRGNQIVTGLVLTIFGTGVAGFLNKDLSKLILSEKVKKVFAPLDIPLLSDIPVIGKALFSQSIYVILPIIIAIVLYIYLNKTKIGLNTRAVGENPSAADASGINVSLYKYVNICIGGALCGLGGAYFSLVFLGGWQNNITSGKGWIAVALIIFSTWNPLKAILTAYAFGILCGLEFTLQNTKISIPQGFLEMIPYVATVVVLIIMSIKKKKENQPPMALGNAYFREER